jgi:hypothetical protein
MKRPIRTAATAFAAAFALAFAAAVAFTGCNKPLDDAQCQQLVEKLVDLAAQDEPAGAQVDKVKTDVKHDPRTIQNVKDTCVGKMTKAQYDCVMSAKTFKDASACDAK